jgi:hypothetical protein
MAGPIYAPQGESTSDWMLKLLVAKQQQEVHDEQIRLQKEELKLRQQKFQTEQAEQQSQQQGVLQNFLQAAQDPAMGQMVQPAMQALGNANIPTPMAMGEVNRVAAPGGTAADPRPSMIEQVRGERAHEQAMDKYMSQLKQSMDPVQFSRFNAVVGLVQQGVPKETLEHYIESEKDIADRLKVLEDTRGMKNKNESDAYAQQYLAERYKINVGVAQANDTLRSLVLADRAAAQARSLEQLRQEGQKVGSLVQIENQLRDNFEQSPVVKTSQSMAGSYGRLRASAAAKTGPADQALIFQFVNMQDQTAARDSERAAIQAAGSLADYISVRFGTKWTSGEVLSDDVRKKIVATAEQMLVAQQASLGAYMDHYNKIATGSGIDPSRIMYDPMSGPMKKADEQAARIEVRAAQRKK